MRRATWMSLALAVSFLPLAEASAQDYESTPAGARYCRAAAVAFTNQSTDSAWDDAGATLMGRCPLAGPPAVVLQWLNPPPVERLGLLSAVSSSLRDQRIFDVVLPLVTTITTQRDLRFAALATLFEYADSRSDVRLTIPSDTLALHREFIRIVSGDLPWANGPAPLSPGVRTQVRQLLGQIATEDPDPIMRTAAKRLAVWLDNIP